MELLKQKNFYFGFIIGILIAASFFYFVIYSQQKVCLNKAEAIFSPYAKDKIINFISFAQNTIDIEMYVLTDEDIINELINSANRGVKIRIILEYRTDIKDLQKIAKYLEHKNIELKWAPVEYKLVHSKLIIVDKKKALVGSINLSKSALEKNRETAILIEGQIVNEYLNIFEEDWKKATYYYFKS
jgi:phosphatidylserine/phosphatidylglycerophosphate/cardiolipin synthase-like enzyme